jgi:hypothetical protein
MNELCEVSGDIEVFTSSKHNISLHKFVLGQTFFLTLTRNVYKIFSSSCPEI